ncbi:MAG: hypothetical protein GY753_09685 [Gammaproteobacteria bacterium]|nr:hypothetical protein [Gammaproteobacteria bacterium]
MNRLSRKKPTYRNINVRLTTEQHDEIERAAYSKGMFKAEYLRHLGLRAAKRVNS